MTVPNSPRGPSPGSYPAPPSPAPAPTERGEARVERARGRLVEFTAFGGALLGSFMAIVADAAAPGRGPSEQTIEIPMILGTGVGMAAGWLAGEATFRLLARRAPDGAWRDRGIARVLVVTPAYLVAGLVGGGVALLAIGSGTQLLRDTLPGILLTLAVAWIVIAPVTLAFAPARPAATKAGPTRMLGCSGTFWVASFVVAWFVGSFLVVLLVLAGLQTLDPAGYATVAPFLGLVALGAWLALWIGGSVAVHRVLRRVLSRRSKEP